MKLTIAIPTYDRNEILNQSLMLLLPQLTSECELLVIDNGSDTPVSETIQEVLSKYPDVKTRLVRNPINIGGNANILRCFELCETEWVWVLSDAYQVRFKAVQTILNTIQKHSDCLYINFKHPSLTRSQEKVGKGIKGFIELMDDYGMALMISTSLFRANELVKQLAPANHFSYTLAPHLVLLLYALSDDRSVCYAKDEIIVSKNHIGEKNWAIMLYLFALALTDVPLPPRELILLKQKIMKSINKHMIFIVLMAAAHAIKTKSVDRSLHHFTLYRCRALRTPLSFGQRIRLALLGILFRYPTFTLALYRALGQDYYNIPYGRTDDLW